MAVSRISQSSLKQGLKKNKNFVADIPPVLGRYYALASETVGAGGAASIDFTNIPQTYKHLQIRGISRDQGTGTGNTGLRIRLNLDSGTNYSVHRIYGNGATVVSDASALQTSAWVMVSAYGGNTSSIFAINIVDILDYTNTSKNKTLRSFIGGDYNGGGSVNVLSGCWYSTTIVNSISISSDSLNNLAQYTSFALYGVK